MAPHTEAEAYLTSWTQRLADHLLAQKRSTEETPPEETPPEETAEQATEPVLGTATLLLLGLLWLAAMLWVTHATLSTSSDAAVVISAAALALPNIVTGALLAGATAGLAAATYLARRRASRSTLADLVAGLCAGSVIGLATAGLIVFAYGAQSSVIVLGVTVAIAAALGGTSAALPGTVAGAGLAAALAVLITGVIAGIFQSPLKNVLGSGSTPSSQFDAAQNLGYLTGVVGGLVAAVTAYLYLRRRAPQRSWPWFALAGGLAGVLLLLSYLVTLIGGAGLFARVRSLSPFDSITLAMVEDSRLTQALLVLFVGAIGAMVGVGRTMRRRSSGE